MEVRFTGEVEVGPVAAEIGLVVAVLGSADIEGTAWITAIANGRHMHGSEHYANADPEGESDAIDLDCLSTEKNRQVTDLLHERLPKEYDVILEDEGRDNEHIHVEHDPAPSQSG